MSKLDGFIETENGRLPKPPAVNFALLVTGYGQDEKQRDIVKGMRLDTGEDVSVFLRPYQGVTKAARSEVKDFVAADGELSAVMKALPTEEMRRQVLKGIKSKTEPGGTVIVQSAYPADKNGLVNAKWLVAAAKFADHCKVAPNVMARIDSRPEKVNVEDWTPTVTVISPRKSQRVNSEDELKVALKAAYEGLDSVKGQPVALVRLSDAGGNPKVVEDRLFTKLNPAHLADPSQPKVLKDTPEAAVERFFAVHGPRLARFIGDPDITLEVIPGSRINMGPQAKASEAARKDGIEGVNKSYRLVDKATDKTGFTPSYLVLHNVGEGQVFVQAQPLSNKPPLYVSNDVPTPFYKGEPTLQQKQNEAETSVSHTVAVETASPADVVPSDEDEEFEVADAVAALPAEATAPSAPRPRP